MWRHFDRPQCVLTANQAQSGQKFFSSHELQSSESPAAPMSSENSQKSHGRSRPNQIPEPAAGGSSSSTPNSPWMSKLLIISPKLTTAAVSAVSPVTTSWLSRGGRVLCETWHHGLFVTNSGTLNTRPASLCVGRALCPCHASYFSAVIVIGLFVRLLSEMLSERFLF